MVRGGGGGGGGERKKLVQLNREERGEEGEVLFD